MPVKGHVIGEASWATWNVHGRSSITRIHNPATIHDQSNLEELAQEQKRRQNLLAKSYGCGIGTARGD
jgi:hypothetical protein